MRVADINLANDDEDTEYRNVFYTLGEEWLANAKFSDARKQDLLVLSSPLLHLSTLDRVSTDSSTKPYAKLPKKVFNVPLY